MLASRFAAFTLLVACTGLLAYSSDWPEYNRTLTSERFADLKMIDRSNVARLHPICTYDLGFLTSFETGPIVVGGTLYATSEKQTFAIDADTCAEKWKVSEKVADNFLKVNRGIAYLDGRLFRGLQDGRVVAYDAETGKKLWQTQIADPRKGESVPAAPIAWKGLVFIGNAGGDNYGVKGRMNALDAATGRKVWETYIIPKEEDRGRASSPMADMALKTWRNSPDVPIAGGATWTSYTLDPANGLLYVPGGNPAPDFVKSLRRGDNLFTNSIVVVDARTGAYRRHFSLTPEDFHDWDVSAAPTIVTTRSGRRLLAAAPKDGHLYGYDLTSGTRLYATPVTTIKNATAPFTPEGTHFCPGTQGGSEWNGPAYSPQTNLIYTGTVDWCSTVRVVNPAEASTATLGQPWTGAQVGQPWPGAHDELDFGKFDSPEQWAGWVTATDADSGEVRWRHKTAAPVLAAITPTAGGLVFAADLNGKAYAFHSENGKVLWLTTLDGAAGGGIITYSVKSKQRVAFAVGLTSPIWPAAPKGKTAKIVVFGVS